MGSTSLTTDAGGNVTSEMRYNPWGEVRYAWTPDLTPGLPGRYTFTAQFSYMDDPTTSASEGFGLMFYNARWYDVQLGRFAQADTIVPGGAQGLDRYAYSYGNPIRYIDPDGHWPCSFSSFSFSCSVSTFNLSTAVNRTGERLGVENASKMTSNMISDVALSLDIMAGTIDLAASAIVTAGIVIGATGGASITLPGGGTAVATGAMGASVGWATAELGVKPLIIAGNALASLAALATVSSELISGDTGLEAFLSISAEGIETSSQVTIGSASQVSIWATIAGWISPFAYPSLGVQTVAILVP